MIRRPPTRPPTDRFRVRACLAMLPLLAASALQAGRAAWQDIPVPHDVHVPHPLPLPAANDVRQVLVTSDQVVWAATAGGVFRQSRERGGWQELHPQQGRSTNSLGPAFCLGGRDEVVWIGTWQGLHRAGPEGFTRIEGVPGPVVALGLDAGGTVLAGGPAGFHRVRESRAESMPFPASRYLGAIVAGPNRDWWIATGMGLYHALEEGGGDTGSYVRGRRDSASFALRDLTLGPAGEVYAAALGGLQEFRHNRLARTLDAPGRLPCSDVRCVAFDPSGRLWAGTESGIARADGARWSVRRGRRWLLHDEVRDIAFSKDGTAWIATAGGVSELRSAPVTFADKAARFHETLEARHVRPPGIVEKCRFEKPGDTSTWGPMDDDNDGGYTALALAMESYRYAVTRDPAALAAARRALSACELLERITGNPGFIARTVVPPDWKEMHDPNLTLAPETQAEERARDPRNKYVPVRWRPSTDGRWLWKGDTSSDEVTAHFFGYFVFHELADDPADRNRVREQVVRIADHLLSRGLVLRDLDGQPTRWGIWAPEMLNGDPNWEMERGINSLEILSFLKLAAHVSGEARFESAYRGLIRDHHYDRNALEAPNLNPAWRTYIDFELLAFAYPALLALEQDPALRRTYRASFERWHETVRADGNPFFEFLYARFGSARRANLSGAMAFLRDTPLDLVRWDIDNRNREDVGIRRAPEFEHWQTRRLLPPSEIGYSRTDQNPWLSSQGEGGMTESDGVFWLLPYWMGRHHGFLR